MRTDAVSTIAMSIYNILSMRAGPASIQDLLAECRKFQHPDADIEVVERATEGLVKRDWIIGQGGLFWSKDKDRRVAIGRDESDAHIGEDGEWYGGWNGWIINNIDGAPVLIEEVIR